MCDNLPSDFFSTSSAKIGRSLGAERQVGRAQLASDVRRIENSGCAAVSKQTRRLQHFTLGRSSSWHQEGNLEAASNCA